MPSKIASLALPLAVAGALAACNDTELRGTTPKLNPTVTRDFTQDSHPPAETVRVQGHTGEPQQQKFEQGEWGALDLLVVVDNSGSMQEEQANLATKLEPLLSEVSRSDWQIAVVTSDPRDGCQRALIKKSDPNAKQRFQQAVNAGTTGHGEERLFLQAVQGLKGECTGNGWVRPGSTVSVLVVTDEDNCHLDETQGYGCQTAADAQAPFMTDYLASIRTLKKDARVYGLMWHPSTPKSQCSTALKQADRLAAVIDAAGGKWGSICDADYSVTLRAISQDIAQILKYEFELGQDPDQGTLAITVDGKAWDKFEVEGRKVRFTEPPPFGAKVEVTYRHGAAGELATEFALDKKPVAGSFKVLVDGVEADPSTYAWDEAKQRLVFTTQPGEKAEIKVAYKERTALREEFPLDSTTVDPRTIQVTVAGAPVAGFTFDAARGVVTISPAPAEAAAIRITYKDKR